jgi:3-dehydroquinate synthase
MATDLSRRLGWVDGDAVQRVRELLQRAGLRTAAPPIGAGRALDLMAMDKKVLGGRIRLVLLARIGEGVVSGDYPVGELQQTLVAHFGSSA